VDFLVRIRVRWPQDGDPVLREKLTQAERERVRELFAAGDLLRIWRVPGRWENVTLWSTADSSSLDDRLRTLPLFPWLDITVEALADHPSDLEFARKDMTP
jgi:muconolactone D-isomerase